MQHKPRLTTAVSLLLASGLSLADNATGPDPYAAGYGFDHPAEAAWGGWAIGATGSLRAEWDSFDDASLGADDDRSAAPDLQSFGTDAASLTWNAGTFVTGSGNLYNFSGPETFQLKLSGNVAATATRVALQVEAVGGRFDETGVKLNGLSPAQTSISFEQSDYPSMGGPTPLQHWLFIWNLPAAASDYRFDFSGEVHNSLTQVAVDVGTPSATDPTPPALPDREVRIPLSPATTDTAELASLHAQRGNVFPESFRATSLLYTRQTSGSDASLKTVVSLKGSIKGLYFDPDTFTEAANEVIAEIIRPGAKGEVKIAECVLEPTRIRLVKVDYQGESSRLGTALYTLDLAKTSYPAKSGKNAAKVRYGDCDVNMSADGVQSGIPVLREGDIARLRQP